MMLASRVVLFAVLFAAGIFGADPREVRWSELAPTYGGRAVEVRTAAGKVRGKLERADDGALVIGGTSVARADITEFRVRRKAIAWRSVFVTWGLLTTLGGAVEGGGGPAAAGVLITAGGFVLGDYLDRRSFRVVIVD